MKQALRLGILGAVAFVVAGPVLGQGAAQATVWPAGDIKWVDNPALKGAQTAALWGDPAKGGYGALRRITAGTVLPLHTHTGEHKVISLAGTIQFSLEDAPAKDLPPGSFVLIPAGLPHAAACKAEADCMYFEESAVAYDMKVVAKK